MAIRITAAEMVSDITAHSARCVTPDGWELSWLPGRRFTHNQAVTAMVTAEELHKEPKPTDRIWWFIESWMGELALDQAEWPWPDQAEQSASRWS
jgi:hypothetical protein